MFRRSKDALSPPKPPTFAQMLEDLTTFEVERPVPDEVRTIEPDAMLISTNNEAAARDANLTQWWNAFETFRTDVQELHKLRRKLIASKNDLVEANDEVAKQIGEVKQKIEDALNSVSLKNE